MLKEEKSRTCSYILRMTLNERIQHILLHYKFYYSCNNRIYAYNFRCLVGFSYKRLSENAFEYRRLLHRIACSIIDSGQDYITYIIYPLQQGENNYKGFIPKSQDLTDAIGVAKFNLGLSKTKPKLDRFSYVEKAEYWALIWGTIIMSATGIIMWFNNTFIDCLHYWAGIVARTVHYYEAWLAILAILVWHLYFVIFNPDIYPMNSSWITGNLTEEEMAEEHPAELDELRKEQSEDENNSESDFLKRIKYWIINELISV